MNHAAGGVLVEDSEGAEAVDADGDVEVGPTDPLEIVLIDHTVAAPPDPSIAPRSGSSLAGELERQRDRLLPCVHCGFCLPACPTYTRLGDEADSPRGRLHLMSAVVEGRLDPGSEAFRTHIDRCLGCRACEPVCPSGVEYGTLLELARDVARSEGPSRPLNRLLLAVFSSRMLSNVFFMTGRALRRSRIAAVGTRVLPMGSLRAAMAMLASSHGWRDLERAPVPGRLTRMGPPKPADAPPPRPVLAPRTPPQPGSRGRVGVLAGCVQSGLFERVNDATIRSLQVNGFNVIEAPGQRCCGAVHAHGGALKRARSLARANIKAFEAAQVEYVVVNSAGCGAAMKDYAELLAADPKWSERAKAFAATVRDATEMLAQVGPHPGAAVPCVVAYDAPCHLLHAQGIVDAPLDVLGAVPAVEIRVVEKSSECCGGAGIYGLTHPELGGRITADKVAAVCKTGCDTVATPNQGCMMQIGAGLRIEGHKEGVIHPVELLDESYRRAGFYLANLPPGVRRG